MSVSSPLPPPGSPVGAADRAFSGRRVFAIVLRHWYLMRGSLPRLLEMAYWPIIQVVTWGFITQFLMGQSSLIAQAAGIFLGAVLLWDVLFRGNLGVSLSFVEEMWSRNLGQLFVSPLRPYELAALMVMSILRTLVGVVPASLLAIAFYAFNIYALGLPLLAFFANLLVMGWAIGLIVCAFLLRFGMGAESMAWVMVFAFWPIAGIYYPIDVMPPVLQAIAYAFPPAHVFEGMRQLMIDGSFSMGHFWAAVGLNVFYLGGALGLFLWVFRIARRRGLLLDVGE
ncbi:ABC transporter permease [Rhodospirillum rubrum]|uniref:ABC-2 transporter component n=1 Tax=Rhodospirillum rubrum (strain ATCC 11170 / ATH 1.1.1 / DSM 467 / LMG 4362 / NCIMB 8255 / S1) TaxID=269796 RepID=Q2RY63_RHORT|nr:ABC transporter permease [Rhodospirillum rubrum]ABC20932.1 ABC-2 transporter component [Rhodospirillum rubrum ATCC 11170]AEO46600.1 ABC-2 transporter component [Rhodospirillum rubrum F11]MBK5952490.1 ABC transporter [Rhodospirillum rubrum]QXG80630.1 ABC transporter permease [Rhodospirillum rubrum]HAQ01288.1 ABC transporter permease [Rhodospirillum rubrum]